jgi:hypothetical protein
MRSADAARSAPAVAILVATLMAVNGRAAEPQYGRVETFEPGKKYTCVPTADHKGWDCKEAAAKDASAGQPSAKDVPQSAPVPAAPTPAAAPAPSPANSVASSPAEPARTTRGASLPLYLRAPGSQVGAGTTATTPSAPNTARVPPPPAPSAVAVEASTAQPQTVAPASAVKKPQPSAAAALPVAEPVKPDVAPARDAAATPAAAPAKPEQDSAQSALAQPRGNEQPTRSATPPASAASTITMSAPPVESSAKASGPPGAPGVSAPLPSAPDAKPAPAPAPPAPVASPAAAPELPAATRASKAAEAAPKAAPPLGRAAGEETRSGNREFLALSSSSYIVELAHSASKSELDALRTTMHPARGALYEVRLQRDGGDWWMLLWGTFDSVDAARAARSELPADAPINAGWPRRVAPLQAEVQRVQP